MYVCAVINSVINNIKKIYQSMYAILNCKKMLKNTFI